MTLGDEDLPLEDAVGQGRHDPQADRLVGVATQNELVAHTEVQHVGQRGRISNRRNSTIGLLSIEQQPGVRAGGVVIRQWQRPPKGKPVPLHKGGRRRQDPRILRLIEIETTGIFSRPHAESREGDLVQHVALDIRQVELVTTGVRVRIVNDRQQRVGQQRVPTGARLGVEHGLRAFPPKGVDRNDDERRGGDQGDAEHASAWAVRRIPEPDLHDGPSARCEQPARDAPAEPDPDRGEQRDEKQGAGTEKARGVPKQTEQRGAEQRQPSGRQHSRDHHGRGPPPPPPPRRESRERRERRGRAGR